MLCCTVFILIHDSLHKNNECFGEGKEAHFNIFPCGFHKMQNFYPLVLSELIDTLIASDFLKTSFPKYELNCW